MSGDAFVNVVVSGAHCGTTMHRVRSRTRFGEIIHGCTLRFEGRELDARLSPHDLWIGDNETCHVEVVAPPATPFVEEAFVNAVAPETTVVPDEATFFQSEDEDVFLHIINLLANGFSAASGEGAFVTITVQWRIPGAHYGTTTRCIQSRTRFMDIVNGCTLRFEGRELDARQSPYDLWIGEGETCHIEAFAPTAVLMDDRAAGFDSEVALSGHVDAGVVVAPHSELLIVAVVVDP